MYKKGLGQGLGLTVLLILTLLVTSYELRVTDLFAEEEFVITTYYPSPYGSYNELQTNKLVIGDANGDGSLTSADQPDRAGDIRLKPQSGDPATWTQGKEGEIAYSSSKDTLYVNNGSKWVTQAGGGGGVVTLIGRCRGSAPTCPNEWTTAMTGYWVCPFAIDRYGSYGQSAGVCFCGEDYVYYSGYSGISGYTSLCIEAAGEGIYGPARCTVCVK